MEERFIHTYRGASASWWWWRESGFFLAPNSDGSGRDFGAENHPIRHYDLWGSPLTRLPGYTPHHSHQPTLLLCSILVTCASRIHISHNVAKLILSARKFVRNLLHPKPTPPNYRWSLVLQSFSRNISGEILRFDTLSL